MEKIELRKLRSYHDVDWFRESYSAQDVLIKNANYPRFIYKDDFVTSVYNDRESTKWSEAATEAGIRGFADQWINATDEQMMKFARHLYDDETIQGCQIVRHTNVSSGYPLWRLDVFKSNNENVEYDFTPNYQYEVEINGEIHTFRY